MGFRVTRGAAAAGWVPGVGDALRGAGGAGVAMLLTSPSAPMFRMRVGKRTTVLEVRRHDASRCTRGRWERLDDADTPRRAAGWGKLGRFWRHFADEVAEGREPPYCWREDRGKDWNRCHTRSHRNAADPTPGVASEIKRLPQRGPKANPTRADEWGYAPAAGRRLLPRTRTGERARARRKRWQRASRRIRTYRRPEDATDE